MIESDVKKLFPGGETADAVSAVNEADTPAGKEENSGRGVIDVSMSAGLEIINDTAKPPRRRYPHEGHRSRVRQRLEDEGIDSFSDEKLLEFLLFGVIPRADTDALAGELMDVFGTLTDVLQAPYGELVRIRGMGDTAASFLRFAVPFARRVFRGSVPVYYAASSQAMGLYMWPRFEKEDGTEAARLLCMDEEYRILGCVLLARGEPDHVKLSVTRIMEAAANYNAQKVVIAHNHTHGFAVPSAMDRASTVMAAEVLARSELGVELVDHIIFGGGGDFVSLKDSGILPIGSGSFV